MNRRDDLKTLTQYLFPISNIRFVSQPYHSNQSIVVIIPSYRPSDMTAELVTAICTYTRNLDCRVVLVDDSSPKESQSVFRSIRRLNRERVMVIRTPQNRLKAGAINYALDFLQRQTIFPDVVFTLDDDVAICPNTIDVMLDSLLSNPRHGAVCSLAIVANKKKNLLTRLQGLEYNGYNLIRIADTNYIQGPLVMHGMAAAFRYRAIVEVGGFTSGHLIEDYDITARLKNIGWHVALAHRAPAYTEVPDSISQLWRQRVRWSTGGVKVLMARHRLVSVFQDIVGHSLFLATLFFIVLSITLPGQNTRGWAEYTILFLSLTSFFVSYLFSIYSLTYYRDGDRIDTIIRCSIIPELIYSLLLTLVQIGAYIFSFYMYITRDILHIPREKRFVFDNAFRKIGFSATWGTR